MLSYFGVSLLQPDRRTLGRLESGPVMDGLWQFSGAGGLPTQPWPGWFSARLNVLYWPQGAARFAFGRFLVGEAQLAAIRRKVFAGAGAAAGTLVISDGARCVAPGMHLVESRPLEKCGDLPGAHLLTLADERWLWRQKAAAIDWAQIAAAAGSGAPAAAQWSSLLGLAGAAVGVSLTASAVRPGYPPPTREWAASRQSAPGLLDAAAFACGLRVVRRLDGAVAALSAAASRAQLAANLAAATPRLGGGRLAVSGKAELDALLPQYVDVVLPFYEPAAGGPSPARLLRGAPHVERVATASLAGHAGVAGRPGAVQTLRRGEDAASLSAEAIQNLADAAALDWLDHQKGPLDECFAGVCPWVMEGLGDLVQYEHDPEQIRTRVRRGPWGEGVVAGAYRVAAGEQTRLEGGALSLADSTLALSGDSSLIVQGGGEVLLEDGTALLHEDGSTALTVLLQELLLEDGSTLLVYQDGSSVLLSGAPAVLLDDADVFVTGETSVVVSSGGSLEIRGGGQTTISTRLEICNELTRCSETTATITTDQTPLEWPADVSVVRTPFDADVLIHGIDAPPTTDQPWRRTLVNVGTGTPTLVDQSGSVSTSQQILLPDVTSGAVRLPPGVEREFVWDVAVQKWRLIEFPAVARPGLPDGQTVVGGTNASDPLTLQSTADATRGGVRLADGDWLRVQEVAAPAAPPSGYVNVYAKADGLLYSMDDAGTETAIGGGSIPGTVPQWSLAATFSHADLTDASSSQTLTAYSLPARGVWHAGVVRTKTAGSGGGVGSLTISLLLDVTTYGNTGNGLILDNTDCYYYKAFAGGSEVLVPSWTASTPVKVQFTADVNVDQLTAGEWEVYLLTSTVG